MPDFLKNPRLPTFRPAVLLLALALSACGFQLRDALVLPPDLGPVKVVAADRYSPLAQSLAQSLTAMGAVPATEDTQDPAVLRVVTERWGDTPISVDPLGRAQEFSLRYAVIFELRKADGTSVVPQQTIELSRDYISVPTNSIGTEGEREILVRELQREMVASIVRRIGAVSQVGSQAPAAQGDVAVPAAPAPDAGDDPAAAAEPVTPQP
ncbi:MAG: LPS assembly lipoprotein LptE [Pseudomonadota bacterium]|nr:LPS assembly lipoprotein LptE [Pseudomonadota bacterium]